MARTNDRNADRSALDCSHRHAAELARQPAWMPASRRVRVLMSGIAIL